MGHDFDAVIAGGSVAGATTAASLAASGLRVLVCESGLPDERRLAGEFMHPPAVDDLRALGLLEPLRRAGGVPVRGFAVVRDADDPGLLLSYADVPGVPRVPPGSWEGLAIEHALLLRTLLGEVASRPGVVVWLGARVRDAARDGERLNVDVRHHGVAVRVSTRLVVSAEGRSSRLRERAGIRSERELPLRMVGWKVPAGRLPHPEFGNVFIGSGRATLSYPISREVVRVMFELADTSRELDLEPQLRALPARFRADVRRAMATQPRQGATFVGLSASHVTGDRLAVVGDAGGCVHPLTASGIAYCTRDAVVLGEALREERGIRDALRRYEKARSDARRTRSVLGRIVVDAFTSPEPDMRLLRHGLFRCWSRSRRGRGVSLGLLSAQETRMSIVAREFAVVVAYALTGIAGGVVAAREIAPALHGLLRRGGALARQAIAAPPARVRG